MLTWQRYSFSFSLHLKKKPKEEKPSNYDKFEDEEIYDSPIQLQQIEPKSDMVTNQPCVSHNGFGSNQASMGNGPETIQATPWYDAIGIRSLNHNADWSS